MATKFIQSNTTAGLVYLADNTVPPTGHAAVGYDTDLNQLVVQGSGSTRQELVDVGSAQTISGDKTFTGTVIISGLAQISEFADGTVSLPSITFNSDPNTGIYRIGADNIGIALGGAVKLNLSATATSPGASDGSALGTTTLMWADLFLASGGVINFNNGNMTLTHSAGVLAVAGGQFTVTQTSSVATATTIRTSDVATTLTGASAVNSAEAFRSTLTANVQTGSYVNAGMFKIDFATNGYSTGTAGVVCAELDLPGSAIPGGAGTYALFEAEINCPTSFVGGGPITALAVNTWGAAKTAFDANGYLFILDGMASGSTSFWYDNAGTAPTNVEEWIRVKTPGGVRYLALYNAVV